MGHPVVAAVKDGPDHLDAEEGSAQAEEGKGLAVEGQACWAAHRASSAPVGEGYLDDSMEAAVHETGPGQVQVQHMDWGAAVAG
jgi:hypothetical protein